MGEDGPRTLEAMRDLFEPGDISTNLARATWAEAKKVEYAQYLAERTEERAAEAQQQADAGRQRAAAAMGIDPAGLAGLAEETD